MPISSTKFCTKYYVRAYAISTTGKIYYGNEVSFTSGGPLGICHPFFGTWKTASGAILLNGTSAGFTFLSIMTTDNNQGFYNAWQKNLISVGTFGSSYIADVVQQSDFVWKCKVLWTIGKASTGVNEVKYSTNTTLTLSTDKKSFTIYSQNPTDGSYSSAVYYKL